MSFRTLEVELENGRVHPAGAETLPTKARALLTLLDSNIPSPAQNCGELAKRWNGLEKLPANEANDFADDIEQARANLPPLRSAWD
jgi:hypothetical protein